MVYLGGGGLEISVAISKRSVVFLSVKIIIKTEAN